MVRAGLTDHARPLRRVDVHRWAPGTAVPVAASAGDGGRRAALRLPPRSVGPAPAHRRLSRPPTTFGPASEAAAGGRRRPAGATATSPVSPPTVGRTRPTTRTCCGGSTSPNSTASSPRHDRYGAEPLEGADRDRYVAQVGEVARALGVSAPPTTERGLRDQLALVPIGTARHRPRPASAARYLLLQPPLPLAARPAYGLIAGAAVALMPAWTRLPLRLPWLPVPRRWRCAPPARSSPAPSAGPSPRHPDPPRPSSPRLTRVDRPEKPLRQDFAERSRNSSQTWKRWSSDVSRRRR